jgi:hypothetical protein
MPGGENGARDRHQHEEVAARESRRGDPVDGQAITDLVSRVAWIGGRDHLDLMTAAYELRGQLSEQDFHAADMRRKELQDEQEPPGQDADDTIRRRRTALKNERAHAIGWAAVIIGALTILRFLKGAGDPPYGVDASYYYQLARHVMNGEGLITTVSLYHEGWVLPARTSIYPLWPLVLGYAGRVLGLAQAADLLPRILYVADLVLLYFLARAVATRVGALRITGRWYVPDAAHWIVAIFGLAPRLFGATTHPYTEGLAFAAVFASFLALERFERSRGWTAAALSGTFAGLAFLARTQMVGVAVGCFLALVFFARRDRSMRVGVLAWSGLALATITPWILFLGFIPGVTANTLPRVDLPRFAGWTESPTTAAWLAQRASSLGVMFDPWNSFSYVQSFGIVAFLVPLAAIAALVELVRRSKGTPPASLLLAAIAVAGVFFFFNLMLSPSAVWTPWLFGWRHGLPYIFLIMLAVPWLVARSGAFAWAIALVLLVSVIASAARVTKFVRSADFELTKGEQQLVRWVDSHPRKLSLVATNAQILGSVTDTRLYWAHCTSSGEMMKAMFAKMPIDGVILNESEAQCRFAREAGRMRLMATFGDPGRRVFVLQPIR